VCSGGETLIEQTTRGAEGLKPGEPLYACSVGKQFVAASAMLLVEAGELDLQAPIGRYLHEIPDVWRRVTTHQLLTHTAGFGHWEEVPGFDADHPPTPDEVLESRATRPLISAPGIAFAYSGVGYLLAARVVERISGQPYSSFTAERIFTPLGMDSTSSAPGAIPGMNDVRTTVADLARYAHAFAEDALLTARSRELMCTAHIPVPESDAVLGETTGYGYGYVVGTLAGRAMHYHPGDLPGYRSAYLAIPSLGASIAVLSNRDLDDAVGLTAWLWESVLAPAARRWQLWREDDNGNRYLMSVHTGEPAARARLADFESGVVHKQRYWIQEASLDTGGRQ
jgi:CubicO group peptidase (beta-lactamase class C family)